MPQIKLCKENTLIGTKYPESGKTSSTIPKCLTTKNNINIFSKRCTAVRIFQYTPEYTGMGTLFLEDRLPGYTANGEGK